MSEDTSFDEFLKDMLPDFLDEATELLGELNENVLSLDESLKSVDDEQPLENDLDKLNIMFRGAHTLKGLSAMLGLDNIQTLTHKMENVFDAARHNSLLVDRQVVDVVFSSIDLLGEMVECLKDGGGEGPEYESAIESINVLLETIEPENLSARPQSDDASFEEVRAEDGIQPDGSKDLEELVEPEAVGSDVSESELKPDKNEPGPSPSDEVETNSQIESESTATPEVANLGEANQGEANQGGRPEKPESGSTSATSQAPSGVVPTMQQNAAPSSETASAKQASLKKSSAAKGKPGAEKKPESSNKPAETIRVEIDRLDQLMNLAGQLVINKARFAQIGSGLKQLAAGGRHRHQFVDNIFGSLKRLESELDAIGVNGEVPIDDLKLDSSRIRANIEQIQHQFQEVDQLRGSIGELLDAVHQLDRVSDGIQKCVMDTRMVPVGPLFNRFKRIVRDISRSTSKEMRLEIRGENTELDKRMIDELADPLVHMVRNSCDHGIEAPEDRLAVGKSREGVVSLEAFHSGNSIVIKISDDGKGLNSDAIKSKAVSKGILSQVDADRLTPQQIFQLIWEPGFSTAEKITEVSGRGMGMDIVRSKIESINGAIELDSKLGEGTTITIKLPLTLAILPSLLIEIDGDIFAVPVENVSEIVSVPRTDILYVHGLETATIRGRVVSVVSLSQLFNWNHPPRNEGENRKANEVILVVVGDQDSEIGLVVDKLFGEEDIVIKSLAENYRNVEGVAGASILGNGRVSLILDVGNVLERTTRVEAVH